MSEDISEKKWWLRRVAYDARDAEKNKDLASAIICRRFTSLPEYASAATVMCYLHCRSEVRTLRVVNSALERGKQLIVPYCTKDESGHNMLGLWRLGSLDELAPGTWNILEPPRERWGEAGKEAVPEELDLIMVPGVAFDRRGGRLGNGQGYYDRLLSRVRSDAVLAGVCYESQLFDRIPMGPHDVCVNRILTEKAMYGLEEA
ncbi:MAG: 5-formyltetrahydrofolate cyclo-ligase [Pseudomonadota bacterium]